MSFGLSRGRDLDDAPGVVGVTQDNLPPLPDAVLTDPRAGRIDPRAWFPSPDRPFELEIGSGKGTFILEQARKQPQTNFLGIEWAGEFYLYAADRIRRAGLVNVRMLNGDAVEFLRWRCPSGIVEVIHLYFSDPWPKTKHHKNRVVQDRFLAECWRVLKPGGELRIVTDHADYWTWMEDHFARWCLPGGHDAAAARSNEKDAPGVNPSNDALGVPPCFERGAFEPPESAGEGELVGTNFERKYVKEGRSFHSAVLRKV